jgi:ABC-2 type transport system permease protein
MILTLFAGSGMAKTLGMGSTSWTAIPPSTIGFFILYFLLGYFFYASIYTAVGAPFNSEQEAQQLAMLPSWLMAVPMFFWLVIANNPNSTFAVILSLIPFMTPVVMFMRVTLAVVPAWQIAASILIMLASILGMAWLAGKIYRVGILMYGKKPTVPEIFRWMKHSDRAPEAVLEAPPAKS